MEDILQQVAALQGGVRRLSDISEFEELLIDSLFQMQSAVDPQPNSQKLPHIHTQTGAGGGAIMQKNGSL